MKPQKDSLAAVGHRKAKKLSVSYWKKKVWEVFSPFIRLRDADESGYVACVSCGRVKHWKEGDAGHFIDGRRNAIVYDPRNVHFQCKPCNGSFINQKVEPNEVKVRYEAYMVERYGEEVVKELRKKNNEVKQWTVGELQKLRDFYKVELAKYQ